MLDRDLAKLYGALTKRLNEQVKRNIKRFPEDFMFQVDDSEKEQLVANCDRFKTLKHSTTNPFAFTEQGVAMLSSVLNSERSIIVNIQIMRAFVELRRMLQSHADLRHKIDDMEKKYDHQFKIIFEAIRQLLNPEETLIKPIGFENKVNTKIFYKLEITFCDFKMYGC